MNERVSDIDDACDFFNYTNDAQLRSRLEEDYSDYCTETLMAEFKNDEEEHIKKYLIDDDWDDKDLIETELTRMVVDDIDGVLADGDGNELYDEAKNSALDIFASEVSSATPTNYRLRNIYNDAFDWWEENNRMERPSESDFFSENGYYTAYDIYARYDRFLDHPESDSDGEYDLSEAEDIAIELTNHLGTEVEAVESVGNGDRSNWIIEPDSSIVPDNSADMPCEIITPSPPSSLRETIPLMDKFFDWAKENGAYANRSTGFHMSLSLPDHANRDIDYIKLVLFLGDKYVLEQFNRASNTFCKSAFARISKIVTARQEDLSGQIMNSMHTSLIELARRCLPSRSGEKYETINMKNDYIEFRSAGNADYFDDIPKIQNTMLRYAQALSIAGNPQAEREEYQKKLYKLMSDSLGGARSHKDKTSDAIARLFCGYSSGQLDVTQLKFAWAKLSDTIVPNDQAWTITPRRMYADSRRLARVDFSDLGYGSSEAQASLNFHNSHAAQMPEISAKDFVDMVDAIPNYTATPPIARQKLATKILNPPTADMVKRYQIIAPNGEVVKDRRMTLAQARIELSKMNTLIGHDCSLKEVK